MYHQNKEKGGGGKQKLGPQEGGEQKKKRLEANREKQITGLPLLISIDEEEGEAGR